MKNDHSFTFFNPGFIKIRKRTPEQPGVIKTDGEVWIIEDCGVKRYIDWKKLTINAHLKEVLKAFIFYRLGHYSMQTVEGDINFLLLISKTDLGNQFPWQKQEILYFLQLAQLKNNNAFWTFKTFYKWGVKLHIPSFNTDTLYAVDEIKSDKPNPYHKVFLSPAYLLPSDEYLISEHIRKTQDSSHFETFRNNVILHLAFELAPRASQIHALNPSDLEMWNASPPGDTFYSLWLPMSKKNGAAHIERRPRKISAQLGKKIDKLIELNRAGCPGIFSSLTGVRLPAPEISGIVIDSLKTLGLSLKADLTQLRHHLAQSLADQGASAEVIAELMGHNSTVPARAYIAATPKIAEIKTRALGKNQTYQMISDMLMTGEVVDRNGTAKNRWVKGMVGSQYIGGIGSCGLPENTACPKNPVYSCYTCPKFHPFIDGPHEEVKTSLQKQAQFFIDTAEKGIAIEHNRPITQLERTIQAVEYVIDLINNGIDGQS